MPKAIWNGAVIADATADSVKVVEGNVYFPREAVAGQFLQPSVKHTACSWKGTASYYDVVVAGKVNRDAAWYYPEPTPAAKDVAGRIAFWRGVAVEP
jgi:uncharacterized protein (DUF427 family)